MDRAWCVPLFASISTFLLTMPFTCFGLLFVLIMDKFGTTREQASWVESVFIMSSNLSALAIAFLQPRISLPRIVVMAAALTSAAIIATAFAPNMAWMSVIFGGAYGFAVKLFMASASIYAMLFFDKYRATAQSFISCAQGAAGMAGQALLSRLEDTYGFTGALVVLGGILMHAVPLCMLLKEAHRIRFTSPLKRKPSKFITNIVANPQMMCSNKTTFMQSDKAVTVPAKEEKREHRREFAVVNNNVTGINLYSREFLCVEVNGSFQAEIYAICHRKTSLISCSSTQKEHKHLSKAAHETAMLRSEPEPDTCRVEMTAPNQGYSLRLARSLLQEPAFYILVLAIVTGEYTEIVFLATAVEYGEDRAVTMQASEQLVTLWFLGQFIGSGVLPVIADYLRYSSSSVYVVTFLLSSISLAVLPHVMNIAGLSVVLATHGMATGFIRCVKCVVIANQVGPERTAACWGISGLAIIPLSLANPVIIGFFRDKGGSYDNFYRMLSGINLFVVVSFALFLLFCKTRKSAIENHNI